MTKEAPGSSALLHYGVLALPVAFAGFPLYVLAPDFYAVEYGVSLATLGVVLLALRLFDAFQDPLIGLLGDRYPDMRPWVMGAAALVLCSSIYALFTLQFFSPMLWFVLCMGLAVTAYSVLSIYLNTLGALWGTAPHQHTRIAATREVFALVGLILAVSLPSALAQLAPQAWVYHVFGLVLCGAMGVACFFFFRWYRMHAPKTCTLQAPSLAFFSAFKRLSRDAKKLLVVYLMGMVASSMPAVLVLFFARDLLGAEQYIGLFLLLYFASGALAMPFWKRMSQRYGTYRTWMAAMGLAISSFIWAFFLEAGDVWPYAMICVLSGMALGADLVFPPAILADQLHARSAQDDTQGGFSLHYGLLLFTAKLALALASAVALPLLERFGFTPGTTNDAQALYALSTMYALVPCLLKALAALLLWRLFLHPRKGKPHENTTDNRNTRSARHA